MPLQPKLRDVNKLKGGGGIKEKLRPYGIPRYVQDGHDYKIRIPTARGNKLWNDLGTLARFLVYFSLQEKQPKNREE